MKILVIALVTIFLSHHGKGQYALRKSKFAQIGLGISGSGALGSGYYGFNFDQRLHGLFGVGMIFKSHNDIRYKHVFSDAIASFTIDQFQKSLVLNLIGGITIGADIINKFKTNELSKQAFFNYGFLGGLEMEFRLSRQFHLVFMGNQRYYLKDRFGQFRYQLVVFFKYNLR